jgi:hypothetical protein
MDASSASFALSSRGRGGAGHDGPDRDVEDLRRVGVAEVADVDEHDDVAEVVRERRKGRHDRVLGEPLDDAVLVEHLLAARLGDPVGEVVVVLLERSSSGRRWIRRPRSTLRFVRMRRSQARRFVPGV